MYKPSVTTSCLPAGEPGGAQWEEAFCTHQARHASASLAIRSSPPVNLQEQRERTGDGLRHTHAYPHANACIGTSWNVVCQQLLIRSSHSKGNSGNGA